MGSRKKVGTRETVIDEMWYLDMWLGRTRIRLEVMRGERRKSRFGNIIKERAWRNERGRVPSLVDWVASEDR